METGRIIFGVVMCVIYFFAWMFLLWEVVKKAEGKNVGWIVLSALSSKFRNIFFLIKI